MDENQLRILKITAAADQFSGLVTYLGRRIMYGHDDPDHLLRFVERLHKDVQRAVEEELDGIETA